MSYNEQNILAQFNRVHTARLCLLWLSFLTQWIVVNTKLKTNPWFNQQVLTFEYFEGILRSSLKRILMCLENDGPLQVTFALPDNPSPFSIVAGAHAANLPVMIHPHPKNPSRGFVSVLTLRDERFSPDLLATFLTSGLSTNVQGLYTEFYRQLGTTRVLHLSPNSDPYVYFAKPYDPARRLWPNVEKSVIDFCRDQRHERTRHLRLSNGVENLKGFRFSFIVREQHMWVDRRGQTRLGGRDIGFAKMLLQFGMRWKMLESESAVELFNKRRLEVSLPLNRVVKPEVLTGNVESTVAVMQYDEHLVVRRAQRMPFGLVLLLPFRWQTWCSLGAMAALMVVAWTLVRTRQVNFVDAANGAVDVLEMVLTGGTSRPIPLLSHRLVFVCGFLMWLLAANAYTGLLLGFLTVPRLYNELDTIKEVV